MALRHPYQAYKTLDVETASQDKLILMLYNAAVRRTEEAVELVPSGNVEKIHKNLVNAQDIFTELRRALNASAGEIADNLDRIYDYIQHLLMQGNIRKEIEPLEEALVYMKQLRDAWRDLFDKLPNSEIPKTGRQEAMRGAAAINIKG
ncbi:flagellar export chaperone FliS [Candidatus Hydrogenedentota bacterium]